MKKPIPATAFFLVCILLSGMACAGSAEHTWYKLVGENKSKRPEFAFVENNPNLPNVLIYGDSISIGYTLEVRKRLEGKANLYRLYCNGGDSASFIHKMTRMHRLMRDKKNDGYWSFEWDVIHFNFGLHDLKYTTNGRLDKKNGTQVNSTEQYAKNLTGIISYLKKLVPKAKLIFATTTPVPQGEPGRFAGDAAAYNKTAAGVMKNYPEIIINDLYSFTKPNHSKWWSKPGNVHYGPEGRQAQGTEVARVILNALNPENKEKQNASAEAEHGIVPDKTVKNN